MRNINLFYFGIGFFCIGCQQAEEKSKELPERESDDSTVESAGPAQDSVDDTQQQSTDPEDESTEVNSEEEDMEDSEEDNEVPTETFYLPDLLQCASEVTSDLLTVRMTLRNIYGQANTEFTLGHVHQHHLDGSAVLAQATYQSQPFLADGTIVIDLLSENQQSDTNDELFGGFGSLSLEVAEHGMYVGVLESNAFGKVDFYCWDVLPEGNNDTFVVSGKEFFYNHEAGDCLNEDGEVGFNFSNVVKVRETGDGECVNMSYWTLEEGDYSYPNLDWDVRGAVMYGTQIHFANMIGADFRGADLYGLEFGYTFLQGIIDEHSVLPADCEPVENEIDCVR